LLDDAEHEFILACSMNKAAIAKQIATNNIHSESQSSPASDSPLATESLASPFQQMLDSCAAETLCCESAALRQSELDSHILQEDNGASISEDRGSQNRAHVNCGWEPSSSSAGPLADTRSLASSVWKMVVHSSAVAPVGVTQSLVETLSVESGLHLQAAPEHFCNALEPESKAEMPLGPESADMTAQLAAADNTIADLKMQLQARTSSSDCILTGLQTAASNQANVLEQMSEEMRFTESCSSSMYQMPVPKCSVSPQCESSSMGDQQGDDVQQHDVSGCLSQKEFSFENDLQALHEEFSFEAERSCAIDMHSPSSASVKRDIEFAHAASEVRCESQELRAASVSIAHQTANAEGETTSWPNLMTADSDLEDGGSSCGLESIQVPPTGEVDIDLTACRAAHFNFIGEIQTHMRCDFKSDPDCVSEEWCDSAAASNVSESDVMKAMGQTLQTCVGHGSSADMYSKTDCVDQCTQQAALRARVELGSGQDRVASGDAHANNSSLWSDDSIPDGTLPEMRSSQVLVEVQSQKPVPLPQRSQSVLQAMRQAEVAHADVLARLQCLASQTSQFGNGPYDADRALVGDSDSAAQWQAKHAKTGRVNPFKRRSAPSVAAVHAGKLVFEPRTETSVGVRGSSDSNVAEQVKARPGCLFAST